MLLEIRDLRVDFQTEQGQLRALDGVSLTVHPGETVALVGESGSGKSVTALSIGRLLPSPPARYVSGEILLDGRDVLKLPKSELRAVRGRQVNYIFQDPGGSLNPIYRVGDQILEALRLHQPARASREEVIRLLEQVRIPAPELRAAAYPHQLSGGMQQRVMIAMALATQPGLLVADEPTTALDVTVQSQIIELLAQLKRTLRMSVLLITHNLPMVRGLADRIVVMYAGQVVESGPAEEILYHPKQPYTRALLESVPTLGEERPRLTAIPGTVPQLGQWPEGCRFHPRCPLMIPRCREGIPPLFEAGPSHFSRCLRWAEMENRP